MQVLVHQFADARLADARVVQAYVSALVQHGSLVAPDDAQLAALVSTLLLTAAINVLLMLLVPRGRKLVLDTAETVLAIALILVLLAVVLGLPLGEWGARRQLSHCRPRTVLPAAEASSFFSNANASHLNLLLYPAIPTSCCRHHLSDTQGSGLPAECPAGDTCCHGAGGCGAQPGGAVRCPAAAAPGKCAAPAILGEAAGGPL